MFFLLITDLCTLSYFLSSADINVFLNQFFREYHQSVNHAGSDLDTRDDP